MKRDIRFGIVGLGMGAARARTVTQTPGAQLVCVCDIVEEKARGVAEQLGCNWCIDYDEMLGRDDIDVVGVFTPSGLHADFAVKALKTGKHVFTTKPMDLRVEKCDEMIEAAEKARVVLAVDFGSRYEDTNRRVKAAISQGRLGRIILGDLRMKWYRSQDYYTGEKVWGAWRSKRRYEGGSAANQGAHYIDLLQWFLGPVKTVFGKSGTFAHEIETEDCSVAFLTFQSGAWGSIITTTANFPSLGTTIEISGDNGTIIWKDEKVVLYQLRDNPEPSLDEFELDPNRPRNIVEDMVSAITKGTPVAVDGKEGRKSVEIFNAIYQSSQMGENIELENGLSRHR